MLARTSDRGEPAKINFCRLRTASVENSPNPCSDDASRDGTFGGNCIALSMKRSSCPDWIQLAEFWCRRDGKKDSVGEKSRTSYPKRSSQRRPQAASNTTLSWNGPKVPLFGGVGSVEEVFCVLGLGLGESCGRS